MPIQVLKNPQMRFPFSPEDAMRRWPTRAVQGAAMLAVLMLSGPAACQHVHETRMHSEIVDDDHRLTIDATGDVRFTDDDANVAYVEPGGRLMIEEWGRGPERRVEFRDDGRGGVSRRFFRDGRETEPDASDRAWIQRAILYPIRESGRNAPRRVARIYRSGGVSAVLAEIREIGSSGAKRAYYDALLRQPGLGASETARVLADAGERIPSSGDKRAVLASVLERGTPPPVVLAALLRAANTIPSSGDRSALLADVAERDALADPSVRDAFFTAAGGIPSSGDKSRVLTAVLAHPGVRREAVASALRLADGIPSSGDRASVLIDAVERDALADASVRESFFAAANGIPSSGDKSRVLIAVLTRSGVGRDAVADALRAADGIPSSSDRARVLMATPTGFLRDAGVRAALVDAMNGIPSSGDRARVATWMTESLP